MFTIYNGESGFTIRVLSRSVYQVSFLFDFFDVSFQKPVKNTPNEWVFN